MIEKARKAKTVEELAELARKNEQCGSCPYFRYCAGGCRAIALALTGDKLGVDPAKCLFYRGGWCKKIKQALGHWRDLAPIPEIN